MKRIPWLFVVCIVAPVLAAVVYLATAAGVYRSTAAFVVRSADGAAQAAVPQLLRAVTGAGGTDATAVVRDYLLSAEVTRRLDEALALRQHYGGAGLWQRFPRPWERATLQRFYEYFEDKRAVAMDAQSGVLKLDVEAFDAQAAQAVGKSMLEMARQRVALLNEQIRRDTLGLAEQELQSARERLAQAGERLVKYRLRHGVLDPERQAMLDLQFKQEAEARLISAQARLKHAQQNAPNSPATEVLKAEVAALQSALSTAQTRAAGDPKESRAALSDEYVRLVLERDIASKIVAAAEEAVVKARTDLQRRHVYVEVLSEPTLPDDTVAPRPLRVVMGTLLFGVLAWATLWLLGIGVQEHARGRA